MESYERIIRKLNALPHQEPPVHFTSRVMAAIVAWEQNVGFVDRLLDRLVRNLTLRKAGLQQECSFYLCMAGLFHGIVGLSYLMSLQKFSSDHMPVEGLVAQSIMAFGLSIFLILLAIHYNRGQSLTPRQVDIFIWFYIVVLMAGGIFFQWTMGTLILAGVVISTAGLGILIGFFLAGVLQRCQRLYHEH